MKKLPRNIHPEGECSIQAAEAKELTLDMFVG